MNSRLSHNVLLRHVIHLSGFLIPLVCVQFFSTHFVAAALFLVIVVYATSEIARKHGINFPVFSTVTRKAAKSIFEINHFALAPIAFTSGIILSLLMFPPPIAYTSIAVLTIGDSVASVFGKIFGKTPLLFNRNKTLEGTICGFTCAFLGAILFVNPMKALVAVAGGMLAESLPLPIDDNLVIPLSAGMALTVFCAL